MPQLITEDEEGKAVKDRTGEKIGVVSDVQHGEAYVTPDPGITEKIMAKLGWADKEEESYPLQEDMVTEVTDDEIRLGTGKAGGRGGAAERDPTESTGTSQSTSDLGGLGDKDDRT